MNNLFKSTLSKNIRQNPHKNLFFNHSTNLNLVHKKNKSSFLNKNHVQDDFSIGENSESLIFSDRQKSINLVNSINNLNINASVINFLDESKNNESILQILNNFSNFHNKNNSNLNNDDIKLNILTESVSKKSMNLFTSQIEQPQIMVEDENEEEKNEEESEDNINNNNNIKNKYKNNALHNIKFDNIIEEKDDEENEEEEEEKSSFSNKNGNKQFDLKVSLKPYETFYVDSPQISNSEDSYDEIKKILKKVKNERINKNNICFENIELPKDEYDNKNIKYNKIFIDTKTYIKNEDKRFFIFRRNVILSKNIIKFLFDENYNKIIEKIDSKNFIKNKAPPSYEELLNEEEFDDNINNEFTLFDNYIKVSEEINDISILIHNNNLINNKKISMNLINHFIGYRAILNDGYSFHRSFLFSLFEYYLNLNKCEDLIPLFNDILINLKFNKNTNINDNTENKLFIKIKNIFSEFLNKECIDIIVKAFNDFYNEFDKVLIYYIQKCISIITENNANSFYECNINYIKLICNIFDVNINLFIIDYNNNFSIKKIKSNLYDEHKKNKEKKIILNLLFMYNSFYIVYLKKQSLSNLNLEFKNNNIVKYSHLIRIKNNFCKICKKNVFIYLNLQNEFFCYECFLNNINNIMIKRALKFINKNFLDIEYYTRPITFKLNNKNNQNNNNSNISTNFTSSINNSNYNNNNNNNISYVSNNSNSINNSNSNNNISNNNNINNINEKKDLLIITNSIINSITKMNLHDVFYENLKSICFNCKQYKNLIINFPCKCQYCENCLENMIDIYTKNYKILNVYELQNFESISCLCGDTFNYSLAIKYSKQINSIHIENAANRLKKILNKYCCNCGKKAQFEDDDFVDIEFVDMYKHKVCKECFELEFNFKEMICDVDDDDDFEYENGRKKCKLNSFAKKVYCLVCFEEHFIDLRDVSKNNKKGRSRSKEKNKKDCIIF